MKKLLCILGATISASAYADLVNLPSVEAFTELIKNDKVVALFVYPPSKPCQKILTAAAKVAKDDTTTTFIVVDIRTYPGLRNQYHVGGLPTIVLFSKGAELTRSTGQKSASALKLFMDKSFNGKGKTFLKNPAAYTVSWIKHHFQRERVDQAE